MPEHTKLLQDCLLWLESDSVSRYKNELPHVTKRRDRLISRLRKAINPPQPSHDRSCLVPNFTNGCPNKKCKAHGRPELAEFAYQELTWESRSFEEREDGYYADGCSKTLYEATVGRPVIHCNLCDTDFPAPTDDTITFE